jgi:hypothetical protein
MSALLRNTTIKLTDEIIAPTCATISKIQNIIKAIKLYVILKMKQTQQQTV